MTTKNGLRITLIWALMIALIPAGSAFAVPADKLEICHRPPDNPDNVRIITISRNALATHLAHGDHPSFGGSCYVVQAGDQNATTSELACQDEFGGHLASIHSLAEDNFISQLVDPDATGEITARIGGTAPGGFCSGPTATYAWTDGTSWDYANWRSSTDEPNCTGAPASVQLWPNTNGWLSGWNDTPSADPLGNFVCKYQP